MLPSDSGWTRRTVVDPLPDLSQTKTGLSKKRRRARGARAHLRLSARHGRRKGLVKRKRGHGAGEAGTRALTGSGADPNPPLGNGENLTWFWVRVSQEPPRNWLRRSAGPEDLLRDFRCLRVVPRPAEGDNIPAVLEDSSMSTSRTSANPAASHMLLIDLRAGLNRLWDQAWPWASVCPGPGPETSGTEA